MFIKDGYLAFLSSEDICSLCGQGYVEVEDVIEVKSLSSPKNKTNLTIQVECKSCYRKYEETLHLADISGKWHLDRMEQYVRMLVILAFNVTRIDRTNDVDVTPMDMFNDLYALTSGEMLMSSDEESNIKERYSLRHIDSIKQPGASLSDAKKSFNSVFGEGTGHILDDTNIKPFGDVNNILQFARTMVNMMYTGSPVLSNVSILQISQLPEYRDLFFSYYPEYAVALDDKLNMVIYQIDQDPETDKVLVSRAKYYKVPTPKDGPGTPLYYYHCPTKQLSQMDKGPEGLMLNTLFTSPHELYNVNVDRIRGVLDTLEDDQMNSRTTYQDHLTRIQSDE